MLGVKNRIEKKRAFTQDEWQAERRRRGGGDQPAHSAHTAQSAWCGRQHKSQPEDTLRSPVGRWMARRSQLTIFLHRSNNQKNPPTLFFSFLFAFLFVLTLTGLARFPSNIRSDISGPFILCSVSCDGYIARVN